ncbi:MAG: globin-coupled sensor protein [Pseudomonadota bacterium]
MSGSDPLVERLQFTKLDAEAQREIRAAKSVVMAALPEALDRFYDQVRSTPETRRFFSDEGHVQSAKSRQLQHWDIISSAQFDDRYVRGVTTVGEVHARIGLEPRWYIGGYSVVLDQLLRAVIAAHWPKRFGKPAPGLETAGAQVGAIVKATLLDMDYAITVYLDAAEVARRKAETEVLAAERASVAETVGAGMAAVAAGDLTRRLPETMPAEYEKLRGDFNAAMQQLQDAMRVIAANVQGMNSGADEISQAADDLSRRTEQQAATLEQTAAALDQITTTVQRTAEGADRADHVVAEARGDAEASGQVVRQAVSAMTEIENSSKQISQIIGVIDEIAFQTNLLALNAGVEAARAGDAGKGFAVVASEVRALAQRSAEAAKEIKTLISASSQQVEEGVGLVGRTGEALERIVGRVAEITSLVSEIAASAREQSTALAEVNLAVNQMDQMTQQNAAMVEESTAASHALASEARQLASLLSRFDVGGQAELERPKRAAAAGGGRVVAFAGARPGRETGWEDF